MTGNAHHSYKSAQPHAKHAKKHHAALTDTQMANIVFNETRSLK